MVTTTARQEGHRLPDDEGRIPASPAPGLELRNWEGSVASYPRAVVEARNVDDIVGVLTDAERYPSPVRAHGSNHSTTLCGVADGGTVLKMRGMDRILEIGPDTVTVQAGALYIDVAKELEKHNLQFYVNVEIGNLSMGAAACTGTKDASMPGEFGQVCSYCIGMKMVRPNGEILEVTEDDPELMQLARSNYGLFGVVHEVTFRVTPLQAMSLEHHTFRLDEFEEKLPELWARGDSMMMYIFPFLDRITVEFRRYSQDEAARQRVTRPNRIAWRVRNFCWKNVIAGFGYLAERYIPFPGPRYFAIDSFNRVVQEMLNRLSGRHTVPTDQMIRYPEVSGWTKYTFSIWAFPEEQYARILREYFSWVRQYQKVKGWRPNIFHVGYRIMKDESPLFSYSYRGNVMTIDPVSTGTPGWLEFLDAYNDFCSEHGGTPLFNQTRGLQRRLSRAAFGERIEAFNEARKRYDPDDRLLNEYFREVLS
jgi:FAD/FMN-containing dehydrogenase